MSYLTASRELGEQQRFAPERIEALADELIVGITEEITKDIVVTIVSGSEEASETGRFVEYRIFDRKFGNKYETLEPHYSPYDSVSLFVLALSVTDRQPIGVVRLIPPNSAVGTRTAYDTGSVVHWGADLVEAVNTALEQEETMSEEDLTKADLIVDVGSLAVNEHYAKRLPRHALSAAVLRASVIYTLNHGYRDYVAVQTEGALRTGRLIMGPIVDFLPGLPDKEYLDAPGSRVVYGNLRTYVAWLKENDTRRYQMLLTGSGRCEISENIMTIAPLNNLEKP